MTIEEFAQKNNLPVLNNHSEFPEIYATHTLANDKILDQDYLLCSDLLENKQFATKIDEYLGTTKYVFFALGKGYLKTKNSIGLVYNPLELAKTKGANLVTQDLLYELDKTYILQNFCLKNKNEIKEMISSEELKLLFDNIAAGKSLLIFDDKESNQFKATQIFEKIINHLPVNLAKYLKKEVQEKITQKYTITDNLVGEIKKIFSREKDFLNKFFNETTEERMFEIRIPQRQEILKGLIGVFKD
jgi:hypothetical protein